MIALSIKSRFAFKIQAYPGLFLLLFSFNVYALTGPASSSTGNFDLTWSRAPDSAQCFTFVLIGLGEARTLGLNTRRYSFSNVPGGTHQFMLLTEGCRFPVPPQYHTVVVTTTPSAPPSVSLPATSSNGNYRYSWSPSPGSTSYRYQERQNSGSWGSEVNVGSSILRVDFSGKTSGLWGYRVKACNAAGCSAYTPEKRIAIAPRTPGSMTISGLSDGRFQVSWASSGSVTKYDLDQRFDSGSWVDIYDGTSRSRIRSLTAGYYIYRVRACTVSGSATACSTWRITGVTVSPDTHAGAPRKTTYTYDALGRLEQVRNEQLQEGGETTQSDYILDSAGNRTVVTSDR